MGTDVPSVESAWRWLVEIIPPAWQPFVGLAGIIAVLLWLAMQFLTAVLKLLRELKEFLRRQERLKEPPAPTTEIPPQPRQRVWHKPAFNAPRPRLVSEGGIPIITTASMKGGVGKTTVTANLAAHFDAKGQRVLLIDFDYQGSLSQTALAAANVSKLSSVVDEVIKGELDFAGVLERSQSLHPALPRSRILTCYYEFSDTETQEMVDWLDALKSGKQRSDIRFRLAEILSDPKLAEHFDVVLIDAPPRFSTGAVNAFCASTHILIPTVLDQMSAEAVVYFSRDLAGMRNLFLPHLALIGVVPTMVYQSTEYTEREKAVIRYLNTSLQSFWGGKRSVLEESPIARRNAIGDIAGSGIGYVDAGDNRRTNDVRAIFDKLGNVVQKRIDDTKSGSQGTEGAFRVAGAE